MGTKARCVFFGVFLLLALSVATPEAFADGFLYSAGVYTAIAGPGVAHGINSSGEMVEGDGFVDSGGTFTTISVPGAVSTSAFGINDAGQIVGSYSTGSGTFGFVDNGGVFTTINVTSTGPTFAFGINNLGQIVGKTVLILTADSAMGS